MLAQGGVRGSGSSALCFAPWSYVDSVHFGSWSGSSGSGRWRSCARRGALNRSLARRSAYGPRRPEDRARLPNPRATRCTRFHDGEPLASPLTLRRARLSEGEALLFLRWCESVHDVDVVEPFPSRRSKSREPPSDLRASRCTRFDVVEPSASRRSARGERLSEELAPRCRRFHDVEPLASRRPTKPGGRPACPVASPPIRPSPGAKGHGLEGVFGLPSRRHGQPDGIEEARDEPHERRIASLHIEWDGRTAGRVHCASLRGPTWTPSTSVRVRGRS
jgi:hypothetical protein